MASKTEMLPHLAVEARCSPSLTIIVGHLPLDKFAVSFASFCILLPADEHRWTCLHCFHVPIWHLKANTFVEAKFSNEADAKQRCNTQSSTWRNRKPRHTQIISNTLWKCSVQIFFVQIFDLGANQCFACFSHRAWDQLLEALEVD